MLGLEGLEPASAVKVLDGASLGGADPREAQERDAYVDIRLADFEASSVGCDGGGGVELWDAGRSARGSEHEEKGTIVMRATRVKSLAKELRWELQTFRECTATQFDEFRAHIRAMDWKFQEMQAEVQAEVCKDRDRYELLQASTSNRSTSSGSRNEHPLPGLMGPGLRVCYHVFQGKDVRQLSSTAVEIDYLSGKRSFSCDCVLTGVGSLKESRSEAGRIANGLLNGEAGCILAYGGKSSGHVLALFGVPTGSSSPLSPSYRSHSRARGLAQEAVDALFRKMGPEAAHYQVSAKVDCILCGGNEAPVDILLEASGLGRRVFENLLEQDLAAAGHSGARISGYQDFAALCCAVSVFCERFLKELPAAGLRSSAPGKAEVTSPGERGRSVEHVVVTVAVRHTRSRKESLLKLVIASADVLLLDSSRGKRASKAYGFAGVAAARARGEAQDPYRSCSLIRALPTFFSPESNSLALICVSERESQKGRISAMLVGASLMQGRGVQRRGKVRKKAGLTPMPRGAFH